eukprot:CAMPEP_0195522182 /NCGR_PEP_ID=MMETSP0794_2-20130614/20089_1 /TAXON_ID=515487 /ORGANISM="Stephanopyxis turris, Strain CCMP 815" /LENGTH=350 /DNA_ID=CAMNT_0040651873 /DNA_START=15 /DNA_END=1067 /DNA_ORIENTATION=-
MSKAAGLFCAIGSAVFNGSFSALFKTDNMNELFIHPMVFQLYASIGVFVSSWLVVPFFQFNKDILQEDHVVGDVFKFSPMGAIAGFLFVVAISASFLAVDDIGVALAQGIWGGVAILVSYLWGVLVFGEVPSVLGLSILAVVLLVIGVSCIANCGKFATMFFSISGEETKSIMSVPSAEADIHEPNRRDGTGDSIGSRISSQRYSRGVMWACAVGLSGGSILAPLHYVPPEEEGLIFLPSFGIGAMLTAPALFYLSKVFTGEYPILHVRDALATGMLSGFIFNIGNLLSIIAIPAIGYGVAYPILQCAILVSGSWGIYLFKEITDRNTIAVFWFGGFILLLGAAGLAISQ